MKRISKPPTPRFHLHLSLILLCCSIFRCAALTPQPPQGVRSADWGGLREAYEAERHRYVQTSTGWSARNPGQQWITTFDRRGFLSRPWDSGWDWGLELAGYGSGDRLKPLHGQAKVHVDGTVLSYEWSPTLTEWFVNDRRGLEHGYTLKQRPECVHAGGLELTLRVRGSLSARVAAEGQTVEFVDRTGAVRVDYSGLKVWDAEGRLMGSSFKPIDPRQPMSLVLSVNDAEARYPLTIDPIAQQAYLKAGNNGAATDDMFGASVAVSGNTVVVGAPQEDSASMEHENLTNDSAPDSGAAYVFVWDGSMWRQEAFLKAANARAGHAFGGAVAISGDTILIGASREAGDSKGVNGEPNEHSTSSGAAYVFVRNGAQWSQQAYLKASNTGAGDTFGTSVAIMGEIAVVGAPGEDSNTTGVNSTPNEQDFDSGALYIFSRTGATWIQEAYVKSDRAEFVNLGSSVAVHEGTVVAGSPTDGPTASGAAYVFSRSESGWVQQARVTPTNPAFFGGFGKAVGVFGSTLAIGAPGENSGSTGVNGDMNKEKPDSGAVYLFERIGNDWIQTTFIKSLNSSFTHLFGDSLSFEADTLMVGAPGESTEGTGVNPPPNHDAGSSGAAYLFAREDGVWRQEAFLKSSHQTDSEGFGMAVAVSGDIAIVGAPQEDSNRSGIDATPHYSASESGAAYTFRRGQTGWMPGSYLKASNTPVGLGVRDGFGWAVAISGNTVAVGAPGEDSDTPGVDGVPNEQELNSGAVFVFVHDGSSWVQQAYLKSSRPRESDSFGYAIALSGDTLVVGAREEDSSQPGINQIPDRGAADSGAAYIFVRTGNIWTQQAYLKASNPGVSDLFGHSVAISGNTVAIGAFQEDASGLTVDGAPDNEASNSGAVYIFHREAEIWSEQAYLKARNAQSGDWFGFSVALSGNRLVVGAPGEDGGNTGVDSDPNESANFAGAAYVYERNGTNWSQQAYLKASNPGMEDVFGWSVATAGDFVVVGAPEESSSSPGVNVEPNELADNAGAAYVFTRDGLAWRQAAYLKSANARRDDRFGVSLSAISNKIAVGVEGEFFTAGAVRLFSHLNSGWSEEKRLTANNSEPGDFFGQSVAMSSEYLIVGASAEDSSTAGVNTLSNEDAQASGATYVFGGLVPDPEQPLSISALKIQDAHLVIIFQGDPRSSYDVERTTSLRTPIAWTKLTPTPRMPSANGSFNYTDTQPPAGRAYYRGVKH
jgi:hypothetical protein